MKTTVSKDRWVLRLYIAGETPRSIMALANLRKICEKELGGRYRLEVIDLQKHPARAEEDQIVAVPTLVRKLPPPMRRIIGDLAKDEDVFVALQILSGEEKAGK